MNFGELYNNAYRNGQHYILENTFLVVSEDRDTLRKCKVSNVTNFWIMHGGIMKNICSGVAVHVANIRLLNRNEIELCNKLVKNGDTYTGSVRTVLEEMRRVNIFNDDYNKLFDTDFNLQDVISLVDNIEKPTILKDIEAGELSDEGVAQLEDNEFMIQVLRSFNDILNTVKELPKHLEISVNPLQYLTNVINSKTDAVENVKVDKKFSRLKDIQHDYLVDDFQPYAPRDYNKITADYSAEEFVEKPIIKAGKRMLEHVSNDSEFHKPSSISKDEFDKMIEQLKAERDTNTIQDIINKSE